MKLRPLALAAGVLALAAAAYAAQTVLTPIVAPETGEESRYQQSVFDVARLKLGQCTATPTGSEPALTAIACNGASGVLTPGLNLTMTSGGLTTVTITNNKVQAGDMVFCMLDTTGANASSSPVCSAAAATANQIVFTITNITSTSPAAPLKIMFVVMSKGNLGN